MHTNHPALARALIDTRERDLAAAAERQRHITQLHRVARSRATDATGASWARWLWTWTIRRDPQPRGCYGTSRIAR
jgi:hypothetical protein